LDFEHTRPDHWMVDLAPLYARCWGDATEAESTFFAGYGKRPAGDQQQLMRAIRWVAALNTVAWAVGHHDPTLEAEGRRALATLASTGPGR